MMGAIVNGGVGFGRGERAGGEREGGAADGCAGVVHEGPGEAGDGEDRVRGGKDKDGGEQNFIQS
jgi:hypothetical protein